MQWVNPYLGSSASELNLKDIAEKGSSKKILHATGHQVRCILWEQVVIINKGIGFYVD